jgi:hypothetical protein
MVTARAVVAGGQFSVVQMIEPLRSFESDLLDSYAHYVCFCGGYLQYILIHSWYTP